MGAYLSVMQVLGIEKDLDWLGTADPVGRELQDTRLFARKRATRPTRSTPVQQPTAAKPNLSEEARDWIERGGFASSEELAALIDHPIAPPKKKVR